MLLNPTDASSYILVDQDEQLDQLSLRRPPTLMTLPCWSSFKSKIERGYAEYLAANLRANPREYQLNYAAVMCSRRFNFMGWQMRSGKTLTTLLVIYGLYEEKLDNLRPKSIHIVVPSILASMSWVYELSNFPSLKDKFAVIKTQKDLENTKAAIIIYNYDFPKGRLKGSKAHKSNKLAKLRPNLLVIDEIHGLKRNTLRTEHMLRIRRTSRRVLGLSGTPSEGTLVEIHTLMNFIYQELWPFKKAEHFTQRFSIKQKLSSNYLSGSQNKDVGPEKYVQQLDVMRMPEYYHLIQRFMHRLNLSDPEVADSITVPETNAVIHRVIPTQEQQQIQDAYVAQHRTQLLRAIAAKTVKQKAEALKLINPLVEIANQYISESSSPKLDKVVELVNQAEGKVIIYCHRVMSARLTAQILRNAIGEEKVIRVFAKDINEDPQILDQDQRIERISQFQYNDEVKVGVFSINLASEAIELNRASDVIFYCLPWSSIQIRQAIARPVGPGNQHRLVKLHYLYHKGFIDDYQVQLTTTKIKSSKILADFDIEYDQSQDLSPTEAIKQLLSS